MRALFAVRRGPAACRRRCVVLFLSSCFVVGSAPSDSPAAQDSRKQQSNLRAAAAKVDITPPVGTPLAGFADRTQGSTGVKDPLHAGILLLDDGRTRAALVTLDLINVGGDETALIRRAVAARAAIPEHQILVAASHTHGGPPFDAETDYARAIAAQVAEAAAASVPALRPVTLGSDIAETSSCVNRRLPNDQGVAEMKPNPAGVIDRRVKVLRVDASPAEAAALVVLVACHANVFRSANTEITADYPGVVQTFVAGAFGGAPVLFLAGAGANIRPNLPSSGGFRNGDDLDLRWVGLDVGGAAVQAAAGAGRAEAMARRDASSDIVGTTRRIDLPGKDGGMLHAEIQALRVGNTLFVTIPGEPFVEYAQQLERALPSDIDLFVVGYSNGHLGYICTADSFAQGGYEPGASPLAPHAERILIEELLSLARDVLGRAGLTRSESP